MVEDYFVNNISYNKEDECNEYVFAAKKENGYMFLTTSRFKFLDVKNYVGPGLSLDASFKSMGCRLQKLMLPYKWLDGYKKLNHVGPVSYEDFYSSLKPTIRRDQHEQFLKLFKVNDCTTMGDWLWVYNFRTLFLLLRPLRRRPSSTFLIRLMYAKTRLVSQTYQ